MVRRSDPAAWSWSSVIARSLPSLRRAMAGLALATALPSAIAQAPACAVADWPLWRDFNRHFITADARVLAGQTNSRDSFSEGQAYAMFFALVANDPVTFERLWRWSLNNLVGGDLAQRLPAWHWGQASDGGWRVIDANSAADADVWFAYALLEAGRLWQRPNYIFDGLSLLKNIERQEVVTLPGLGAMLLPGPYGFVQADGSWRLNPSYSPIPLLRRFAREAPNGPWSEIASGSAKMIINSAAPKGLIADWIGYRAGARPAFTVDPVTGALGSYDAIRVYLWAALTPKDDPLAAPLLRALHGMARLITTEGAPPEKVNVWTGVASGSGPYGFSAALLPYLSLTASTKVVAQQAGRARSLQGASLLPERLTKAPPVYYDHVLSLFGLGWIENRYTFLNNGQVQLKWHETCTQAKKQ